MQTKCKIYHACKYNIIVHLNEALPLSDMKKNHWNLTGINVKHCYRYAIKSKNYMWYEL